MRKSVWLWVLLIVLAILVLGLIFGGYRKGTKLGLIFCGYRKGTKLGAATEPPPAAAWTLGRTA